jgi:hypothetical protein
VNLAIVPKPKGPYLFALAIPKGEKVFPNLHLHAAIVPVVPARIVINSNSSRK